MNRLILMVAVAAVAVPAAVLAATGPSAASSAQTDCTKLRATMGAAAFAQAYPTFGACVSRYAPVEQQSISNAQSTCGAQQSDPNFASTHDGKTFVQYYGTGKSGKNAFGNCVSAIAKANAQAEQQGRLNPARTCRSIRTQLTSSVFSSTYGKNANDRNAFGKCVSKTAAAQAQNELSASKACSAEASDATFASSHNSQTFAQVYGTNADGSNAFGMCVSSKARASSSAQQQATVKAAKTCAAELNAGATAFKSKYGTFGHCVAEKIHA
jgi:hypothetical protein